MRFQRFLNGSAALVSAVLLAASAQAVTIDFSGYGTGGPVGNTYAPLGLTFSNATFAQCGGGCPAPTPNGYFAYAGGGGSFTAFFSAAQTSVSFQSVSFSSTLAEAYDASNTLIDSVTDDQGFPINNQIDTLSGANITKIVFSFNGGYNGPAITNLTFTPGAVPEPATWAMMVGGFGAAGATMRRRRRIAVSHA